jgi:tight adherence protein C
MARAAPATDRRLATLVGGRMVANTYAEDDGRMSRGAAVRAKLRGVLPRSMLDRLAEFLVTTGVNAPPETVAAVWALVALGPVTLVLIAMGGIPQGTALFMVIAMVALGAYAPLMLLRGRARSRRNKILRNLPDVMDLLTTCVEAGLGIDAALARVAEKAKEPLAAELRLVLRTMAMGGTRRDALQQLSTRTLMTEITSFTTAVIRRR